MDIFFSQGICKIKFVEKIQSAQIEHHKYGCGSVPQKWVTNFLWSESFSQKYIVSV